MTLTTTETVAYFQVQRIFNKYLHGFNIIFYYNQIQSHKYAKTERSLLELLKPHENMISSLADYRSIAKAHARLFATFLNYSLASVIKIISGKKMLQS